MHLSNLINNLPPYHFADAKKKIADRKAAGVDVINLSMGDPDLPAPQAVIDRLCATLQDPENHRYPEYFGMRALHLAFASWFKQRFDVRLTPEQDTLPLLGSKEGLAYVGTAVLNAGDVSLIPDPCYPVYTTASTNVGAVPYKLPLLEAYAEVYFDEHRPISILQVPGASEVAVELHSLSKTYNMAGFRVGMLVGNPEIVNAVGRLKSNIDSGMFRPIQYAGIEAMQLPDSWLQQRNAIYRRRRDLLVDGCNSLGMPTQSPKAGLYVWAAIPRGFTSRDFASWLFEKTGVYITPGTNFGSAGEGYVRISLTAPDERIEKALQRMKTALEA